jgi:hypothetical protein
MRVQASVTYKPMRLNEDTAKQFSLFGSRAKRQRIAKASFVRQSQTGAARERGTKRRASRTPRCGAVISS